MSKIHMNQGINYLLKEEKKVGIKNLKHPKVFIDYSQTIDDVYGNLESYNPKEKRRVLIVFDEIKADIEFNKKLCPIVTELFLRERKFNISLVFISQSYFKLSKTISLNATHYFIMNRPNKSELQKIASHHSSDIDFKDFIKLYKMILKNHINF